MPFEPIYKAEPETPGDALVMLGALEIIREERSLSALTVSGNSILRQIAEEFRYSSIFVQNSNVISTPDYDPPVVDLSSLLEHLRDTDPVAKLLVARIKELEGGVLTQQTSQVSFPDKAFQFSRHVRLGDSISVLIGLEAYCVANDIKSVEVVENDIFSALTKLFDFRRIKLVRDADSQLHDADKLLEHSSWYSPWLKRFSNTLHQEFGGRYPAKISVPKLLAVPQEEPDLKGKFCCQFDSRSHKEPSIGFAAHSIRLLCPSENTIILGGLDTSRYLGESFRYITGDLDRCVNILFHAKAFIGCDSGLAHLAGILGLPSIVINYAEYESVQEFFRSYPATVVLNNKIIELTLSHNVGR